MTDTGQKGLFVPLFPRDRGHHAEEDMQQEGRQWWQEQEVGCSPYIHAEEAKVEWEMGQAVKPPIPPDLCDKLLLAGLYIPKVPQPSHTSQGQSSNPQADRGGVGGEFIFKAHCHV